MLGDEELEANTTVTISGWGEISDGNLDDPNPYSEVLNYISLSMMENIECERIYGYQRVTSGVVCTSPGDPVKSPCFGDSGAPVVVNVDSNPVHVAIFSFINGYGCVYPYPAGKIRTAYYRD